MLGQPHPWASQLEPPFRPGIGWKWLEYMGKTYRIMMSNVWKNKVWHFAPPKCKCIMTSRHNSNWNPNFIQSDLKTLRNRTRSWLWSASSNAFSAVCSSFGHGEVGSDTSGRTHHPTTTVTPYRCYVYICIQDVHVKFELYSKST